MADAPDSKSGPRKGCGFKSHLRYYRLTANRNMPIRPKWEQIGNSVAVILEPQRWLQLKNGVDVIASAGGEPA
jgi:hypothetical protein